MAQFFRDQHLPTLTISEDKLAQLNTVFCERALSIKCDNSSDIHQSYIIRFDGKGYRLFALDELLRYFHQAKEIERIIFTVETSESLRTSRQTGTHLELRLEKMDANNCYLSVTADDVDWVEASFSAVKNILDRCKNRNVLARSSWFLLITQITGVTLGFAFSLWAAMIISPKLAIENAFVFSFLFILLIFSNTWMYIYNAFTSYISSLYPVVDFFRPKQNRVHWLMQAAIAAIAGTITLYGIGKVISFIGDILGAVIK